MDALACPKCGGQMKVIAFIEPPQGAVVEKILRHGGLWHPSSPRPPPAETRYDPDSDADGTLPSAAASREQVYVDIDTFWATLFHHSLLAILSRVSEISFPISPS